MYDFDDYYYEPGEFDEKIEELKDAIRDSVKEEIKSELECLREECQQYCDYLNKNTGYDYALDGAYIGNNKED